MGASTNVMTPEQAKQMSMTKNVKPPALQNAIDQAISTGQNVQYTPDFSSTGGLSTSFSKAPEPYVPESAKAAGALYEAGVAPSIIRTMTNESSSFDPVAYRNQFKSDSSGLASVAQPTPPPQEAATFNPSRGKGEFSPRQQMPSFYQQPMGMMAQPFNPMGYGPMGMFMNPYGGLGGISYNFMNRQMPNFSMGTPFTAGQYQAPEPIKNPMVNAASSFFGGFGFY